MIYLFYIWNVKIKKKYLRNCVNSFNVLGRDLSVGKADIETLMKSSIFYRCLYNVGFASRHRNDKTLLRTINELDEIVES